VESASSPNVIGFAHRGAARTRDEQNTLAAFERALALGAGGLETDVWLTSDGVPVLLHPRVVFRKGPDVAGMRSSELPDSIPTLSDLYEQCGNNFDLALDMREPKAAEAVMEIAAANRAAGRIWLTYWRLSTLESWRETWPRVHLIFPTIPLGRRRGIDAIERLAAIRVDTVNVFHPFCTASLVGLGQARGLKVFAWGIRRTRSLRRVVAHGVDGVFCDDVPSMVRLLGPSEIVADT
jgi:glycerophosphoryl diester phosphodiesterase